MQRIHFKGLDAIRTIAFISTFLAHSISTQSIELSNNSIFITVTEIATLYGFGVPVFFVLSGFLITFLMIKDRENGLFSIRNFYIKRILRIWPAYYIVIIFGFLIFPFLQNLFLDNSKIENATVWMYIGFLSNFDQIYNGLPLGAGLGPTWSVSVEEQFYLFWPLLFLVVKPKYFIYLILSVLTFSLLFSQFGNIRSQSHTAFSMIFLSVGSLFGYLYYYNTFSIRTIHKLGWWVMILAFAVSCAFYWIKIIPSPLYGLFFSIAWGVIIIFQIHTTKLDLSKIKFLERNGKYTYGLYLYHSIAIFIIHSLFRKILKMEESLSLILLIIPISSLILSFIFARVSYWLIESKFLNLKRKL
ncbi:MAG: hypothetical protein A3F72_05065 [Bacteroidetes bacterium RIFCSPLOWO2_12_FULL_35_15]|nr:MAG: hypothetical protein A3F72_05065 [Bacteroidetes bacterium RIFCSPLOWO2_12_FULL_35_15]